MSARESFDFDLHGAVGLRLVDATQDDAAVVRRQLGPLERRLERDPDILIRFVETLTAGPIAGYLGDRDVAYTDDSFLILRGKYGANVRVRIPFEQIGGSCEIVCERGLAAIPHLVAIVNLTALTNGRVPIHAAGFVFEERGILVTGWSKGGKTETLLGFMARGADYVGDEWLYVDPTTGLMAGLPEPMRVWDWQLRAMPRYAASVPGGARAGLAALRLATAGLGGLARTPIAGRAAIGRTIRRALPLLERQRSVRLSPRELFGDRIRADPAPIDRVLLVVGADRPDIAISQIDPDLVARRVAFSLEHERSDLLATYAQFRYAFPDAANRSIDGARERERELLQSAFHGRPSLLVEHPHPPDIERLAEAIEPHLR